MALIENDFRFRGACTTSDPDLHFPTSKAHTVVGKADRAAAKAVCAACPVITECRADALRRREPHGIWGGLDEHERTEILLAEAKASRTRRPAVAA